MYDQFYGFSGRPFQLAPDPEFYFESLTHRKALSYLGYGLAQGEGFIVITGEVGAGKSTLAAHLVASIDRQRLTAAQIVTSRLDANELVRLAAQAFGIVAPSAEAALDKAAVLGMLEEFLQEEARAGRRSLLIVDEAQNLSIQALEELRMLSNFHLGSHPLLQIVLLGQPEFRELLAEPALEQLRQRVIATHHLEAMEADEVGPYVEHRLKHVGWSGRPAFGPGVYERLAEASGAVPRRINQLVNRLLLLGSVEKADMLDVDMLEEVIADLAGDEGVVEASSPGHVDEAAPEPSSNAAAAVAVEAASPELQVMIAAELTRVLAQRDEQIAELQQAVMELAEMRPSEAVASPPEPDLEPLLAAIVDLTRRIESLETRTSDQNEAIRHVLTMLIEWLESENATARAA
ncbi:ATPase [Novosphingobium nitrogenifigens DSM 19370]|uniref:ATPase n=1 Tax=Novosphingobium nitrogenifigens DSM 19370 TaxID=983920 RepID=F1Z929_9SPHN|nr:XrtA/PEP-CTERM system-associated ATPase [Novosphingobium nitrogenifigens]EGD58951.1 ATPase [Novosphingobium nitrogenifigens DSM 19370]